MHRIKVATGPSWWKLSTSVVSSPQNCPCCPRRRRAGQHQLIGIVHIIQSRVTWLKIRSYIGARFHLWQTLNPRRSKITFYCSSILYNTRPIPCQSPSTPLNPCQPSSTFINPHSTFGNSLQPPSTPLNHGSSAPVYPCLPPSTSVSPR